MRAYPVGVVSRALLVGILLAGCEPGRSDGAGDASSDSSDVVHDAGARQNDADASAPDAGVPLADAGGPAPLDAGASGTDDAGNLRTDAGDLGSDAGDAGAVEPGPASYPHGEIHSPLTPRLVDGLRAVRAAHAERDDAAFTKVGDSITASTSFLHCFAGATVDLDGRSLEEAVAHFADSFDRDSEAAMLGWNASAPLDGEPSPLDAELAATSPAFALVMFGTNDLALGDPARYANDMLALVDALLDAGVIPIVSSIPPRGDSVDADADVPRYNLVARGVAQARQVPFVDLELLLRPLASFGLGGDELHPSADPRGACVLDAAGLEHGYNLRNLVTLEALDRVRRAVVEQETAPDPDAPPRAGSGTASDPFVVDALPYTAYDDTAAAPTSAVDAWTGCSASDQSGPELYYRLELDAPARIRVRVADGAEVDVDLNVISAGGEPIDCVAQHDRDLVVDLPQGQSLVVIDTADGVAQAGPFLLTIAVD
jgi:hypothetical protein